MKWWTWVQLKNLTLNKFNFEGWNSIKNIKKKTCKKKKIATKITGIKFEEKKNPKRIKIKKNNIKNNPKQKKLQLKEWEPNSKSKKKKIEGEIEKYL